jgi:hypothetical protein
MSSFFGKFLSSLRKNVWALAAFIIPLAIRSVPEILSWPYPMGLDTLTVVPLIQSGHVLLSGPLVFVHTQLFYSLATLVYWVIGDPIVVLKIFGPLLMGLVSVMMYLYARRGLGWSGFKSFLVALFVAIYFVSLRNSWDLYSQSFALVFLLAALVVLKSSNSSRRYSVAFVFMVLTVLSHELAAVILFFVLGFEAVRFLVRKMRKDFAYSVITASLAGALFLFTHYSPQVGGVAIPIVSTATEPSVALAFYIGGLLVYCYILILPLVILGFVYLKDWVLRYWVVLCVGIPLLTMLFPTMPLYYWNRWVYLLVYPLLFFAVHGLDKLWKFWSSHKGKIKRLVPKVFAISYLVLLLSLSGFYLAASPENQISFFSKDNPYLAFIPSSMLQNTLPISDNPALVKCFEWINNNTAEDSAVVMHYALYDLAVIYVKDRPVIPVNQGSMWEYIQNETVLVDGMVEAARVALSNGHCAAYTVWWVSEKGWYGISTLPSDFREVYRSGEMAVYLFDPTA